jgi:hypothetical protein
VRLNVDLASGVCIIVPDATRSGSLLENGEIAETRLLEFYGGGDPAEAAADDGDTQSAGSALQFVFASHLSVTPRTWYMVRATWRVPFS